MKAHRWPITFSIGAALFESVPATTNDMIATADELMYQAKKSDKDGMRFAVWDAAHTR